MSSASTVLRYCEGTSDKEYRVAIGKVGAFYDVTFAYHNGTMKSGTMATGISFHDALELRAAIVNEKLAKGYFITHIDGLSVGERLEAAAEPAPAPVPVHGVSAAGRGDEPGMGMHIDRGESIQVRFDSWDQLLDYVERQPRQTGPHCLSQLPRQHDTDWLGGVENIGQALHLARNGWKRGQEWLLKMKIGMDSISPTGGSAAVTRFSESGDDVDVDRFLEGEPDHMIEYPLKEFSGGKGGRVVKLLINITAGCSASNEACAWRGAIALKLADVLEQSGYRVELAVGEVGIRGSRKSIFVRSIIKRAEEHVDIDRLAFAFCHVAAQRFLFFRMYEHLDPADWDVGISMYGSAGNFNEPDPEVIEIGCVVEQEPGAAIKAIQKLLTTHNFDINIEVPTV